MAKEKTKIQSEAGREESVQVDKFRTWFKMIVEPRKRLELSTIIWDERSILKAFIQDVGGIVVKAFLFSLAFGFLVGSGTLIIKLVWGL